MKKYKYISVLAFCISAVAGAQNFSQYSVQQDSLVENAKLPDLSYYSKNYNTVFGEYNYTFNTTNFGARNVYVSENNFYYNGSQNLPYLPPVNQCYLPGQDTDAVVGVVGISIIGLKALFDGNAFAKDYTPKNMDKSLFHPGE